jgi:hypothetical protein
VPIKRNERKYESNERECRKYGVWIGHGDGHGKEERKTKEWRRSTDGDIDEECGIRVVKRP